MRLQEYGDDWLEFHHSYDGTPREEDFMMHTDTKYELLYFLSGSAKFLVESAEYDLRPGCLLIARPLELHQIKILESLPYERIVLNFSAELVQTMDPDGLLLRPFDDRPVAQYNFYGPEEFRGTDHDRLLKSMCVQGDRPLQRVYILSHFYPVLCGIRDAFRQKAAAPSSGPENRLVDELVQYINAHLFEDLSLPALSSRFFVSPTHLNRLFKQFSASGVWEYILFKRLVAARTQIKSGCPVVEASQNCGFKDYSSFYRSYVKRFGISPKRDKTHGEFTSVLL